MIAWQAEPYPIAVNSDRMGHLGSNGSVVVLLFSTLEKELAMSALRYLFPCLLAIGALVPASQVVCARVHVAP